jgi:hypothetical protein
MLITEFQEKYCVPPITKCVVKQRPISLLPCTWDAYYMHDRHVLGEGLPRYVSEWWSITATSSRRTASYPIDCAEFPDAKATEGHG